MFTIVADLLCNHAFCKTTNGRNLEAIYKLFMLYARSHVDSVILSKVNVSGQYVYYEARHEMHTMKFMCV